MDKTYKCDRCRCQDICKLENAFHNTQDKLVKHVVVQLVCKQD